MRTNLRAVVLFVTISIMACQAATNQPSPVPKTTDLATPLESTQVSGTDDSSATPADPTQVSETEDVSWIFEIPADPIHVDVVLETNNTVEALIPLEGGRLSVTGADGTVYTLEVPADALLSETTIGMTPASGISGMPFGGEQTYSVQFSPDGLSLYNDAVLTITPAEAIPLEEQIVFGYEADGKDLILATPVAAAGEIKIRVQHFSGNGVTKGLLADIEPVRERLGGAAQRRLESALNAELIRIRNQGGDGEDLGAVFAEFFRQYEEQVVKPRVAAAGESCAAGQLALQTVLGLERMRQLTGVSDGGDPLAKYPGLLDKATRVCVVEEYELCVEQHVIHRMVPVWLGYERLYQLLGKGDPAVLREARELTVKCLTFKLMFESTGTASVAGDLLWESTVTSEITLRFNPDELTVKGEAPLVNEHFEFVPIDPDCSATSIRGGGTFLAFNLITLDAPGASDKYQSGDEKLGHVRDFVLSYFPGASTESGIETCPTYVNTTPNFSAWITAFTTNHLDESPPDAAGFNSVDWEIFGDEYFAKKEWIKESEVFVEAGTFKLYHKPGG